MIKDYFHGCVDMQTYSDHYFLPMRVTKAQLNYCHSVSENFYERAVSTAGITLEFTTSQPVISFRCSACAYSRSQNTVDIYENGRRTAVLPFDPEHSLHQVTYTRTCRERSAVKIYLPVMACLRLSDLDLGDAEPIPQRKRTLLCLGDSITQGIFAQTASSAYPSQLGRAGDIEVINQGVGGFYYDKHFPASVPADYITVAYGTNDFGRFTDVEAIRQNVEEFYDTLNRLYPAAKTAVISPLWRADLENSPEKGRFDQICRMILETADRYGFVSVDGMELVDHNPELFRDRYLHPDDAGFEQLANRLITRLQGIFPLVPDIKM